MDMFRIIISTRLKGGPVAEILTELGTDIKYMALRRGEFVVADRFGIMYLKRDEFIRAIKMRSIYRDISELKRSFTSPIVLIEGEDPLHDDAFDLATIQGVVLFASALNRVPIITTRNEMESAQLLFMMAAQSSNSLIWQMAASSKEKKPLAVESAVESESEPAYNGDPRVGIISRLPDVGPALAKGLLEHFGSLSRLFAAEVDDLTKVNGIGRRRAQKIFAFLNGNRAA